MDSPQLVSASNGSTVRLFRCVGAILTCVLIVTALVCAEAARGAGPFTSTEFSKFALTKEGDARRGQKLFGADDRLLCVRCHTIDGTAGKAGPDLFAVGDKYGRRELIEAVLTPSASIAVGYNATTIETKTGDEFTGIIKQASDSEIGLMGADAQLVRVPMSEITNRRTSEVSLMPEGLQEGLSLQEFTDLIDYLASLKQPSQTEANHHGMPEVIQPLAHPVGWHALHGAEVRFAHPVWMGLVPGELNVFLVAEHESGKVWRLDSGAAQAKTLFLDTGFHDSGARGLLELAFHPQFVQNGRYYSVKQILEDGQFASVIYEHQAAPDHSIDSGRPPRRILSVKEVTNVNHAGSVIFGADGYMYIGMGDSGPGEDPQGNGQNTALLLGKILRIDVDHVASGQTYSVPKDNPGIGRANFRPEIWAYGLREPWRLSFDTANGDLWVGDVGQDRCEEVDLVRPGENFGWNVYEGFEPFSNRYRKEAEKYASPIFAYRRKYGPCVTGGYVYRGNRDSTFYGVYIFGDFESKRVFGLTHEGGLLKEVRQIGAAPQRIASFGQDSSGELYVVGYEGTLFKLELNSSRFE